ncbi:MAG: hypothetical protein EXR94_00900 [Gemmatimonadetes bacterium]|nr:hypothetical protein [Gemmatimonadota bacterium]
MMIPVFVNDRRVAVAPGTTAAGAAISADASHAETLGDGRAYLTDGRGIRMDPSALVGPGAIIRVVTSARRVEEPPDDHA